MGATLRDMGVFRSPGMGLTLRMVRKAMPLAPLFAMLPMRSELPFVLLLATYLATESVAPLALQIISAALLPGLAFAMAVSRIRHESNEDASCSVPFLAALTARAPPVS